MVIEYIAPKQTDIDPAKALEIIKQYKGKRGSLISVLQKFRKLTDIYLSRY